MGFTLQVGSEVIGAPDLFPEVPEYNDVLEKVFATRQKWTYDELADLLHGLTSRLKSLVDNSNRSEEDSDRRTSEGSESHSASSSSDDHDFGFKWCRDLDTLVDSVQVVSGVMSKYAEVNGKVKVVFG